MKKNLHISLVILSTFTFLKMCGSELRDINKNKVAESLSTTHTADRSFERLFEELKKLTADSPAFLQQLSILKKQYAELQQQSGQQAKIIEKLEAEIQRLRENDESKNAIDLAEKAVPKDTPEVGKTQKLETVTPEPVKDSIFDPDEPVRVYLGMDSDSDSDDILKAPFLA